MISMSQEDAKRVMKALDDFDGWADHGCPPSTEVAVKIMRGVLAEQPAPAQDTAWEHHAKKLTQWLHCMSYSDSYFGEPAGLVKQVTGALNRLIGAPLQPSPSTLKKSESRTKCGKCEASDPAFTDICQVPACGMREGG